MAKKIVFREDQRFECRDCPSRCCRVPWNIRFSEEEIQRFVAEPWVRKRAGADGLKILSSGVLPMRDHDRRLQCVFLDDDGLCGMQKKFGHEYIPRSCQSFPFGFRRNERGQVVAELSHLCPSIRDNYGNPVGPQLKAKLAQRGEVDRMSSALSTRRRVFLSQKQYLMLARSWQTQLASDLAATDILATICDQVIAFENALPEGKEKVADTIVTRALEEARSETVPAPLEPRREPSFQARAMFSYLLGGLCYPSRVRHDHRVGPAPKLMGMRGFFNKLAWMRGRGKVDMLFVPRPFRLQHVSRIAPFLTTAEGALARDYLALMVERRQIFSEPRYILASVVDMCLAVVLISRFARCSALAHEREKVEAPDVHEGISVAELVLSSHIVFAEEGATMKNLRALLMSDRNRLRHFLAGEA